MSHTYFVKSPFYLKNSNYCINLIFSIFGKICILLVFQTFSAFRFISSCHFNSYQAFSYSKNKTKIFCLYFCVTLCDSVFNKQIITWQDQYIVFIHEFWHHSANERVFKRVSGMIPKQVNKNNIQILLCNNFCIILFLKIRLIFP